MSARWIVMAPIGALALVAVAGNTAVAASKCSAAKIKATGKKAAAKLTCLSKGIGKSTGTDSTCLAKAEVKFSSTVAKAEAKTYSSPDVGCLTTGDLVAIEAKVDSLVDDIDSLVADAPPNPANACDANKVKAAGKKVSTKLACHAKAIAKGGGVDSTCLAKAEVKFSAAAAKAETKVPPPCTATGDFATYESTIDAAIDDIVIEVTGTPCPVRPTGEIGGPCAADSDCDSTSGAGDGFCYAGVIGTTTFPPGGYCVLDDLTGAVCSVDADCGTGNVCVDLTAFSPYRVCMPACGECGGTTCPEGQACFDSFNSLALDKTACVPGNAAAADGDACDGFFDCNDRSACITDALEFPGGQCARSGCTLGNDATCHGGHCIDVSGETPLTGTTCVDTCTSDGDCRQADGYDCFDAGGGTKYCRHPHVGDPCATGADCGGGAWVCLTGGAFAGGYCTQQGCTSPGTLAGCSPGSTCFDDPISSTNYCADRCDTADIGTQGRCRTGYVCTDADPSPGTSVAACVP